MRPPRTKPGLPWPRNWRGTRPLPYPAGHPVVPHPPPPSRVVNFEVNSLLLRPRLLAARARAAARDPVGTERSRSRSRSRRGRHPRSPSVHSNRTLVSENESIPTRVPESQAGDVEADTDEDATAPPPKRQRIRSRADTDEETTVVPSQPVAFKRGFSSGHSELPPPKRQRTSALLGSQVSPSTLRCAYDARDCWFFHNTKRCKRGSSCKFLHARFDSAGKLEKFWPTRFHSTNSRVAFMTQEEMLGTTVLRTNDVHAWLFHFLEKHSTGAGNILGQRVRKRNTVSWFLNTRSVNELVQDMGRLNGGLRARVVRVSEAAYSETVELKPNKNITDGPFFHCTNLQGALQVLLRGHLVASTNSWPHGCYFSPSMDLTSAYFEGAVFEAKLCGVYSPAAKSRKFGTIPMGVVARLARNARDHVTDMFSHQIVQVTFDYEMLKLFLQRWHSDGQREVLFNRPTLPVERSHRLVVLGDNEQIHRDLMVHLDKEYALLSGAAAASTWRSKDTTTSVRH